MYDLTPVFPKDPNRALDVEAAENTVRMQNPELDDEQVEEEAKKLLVDCNQDAIWAYRKLAGLGDRGVLK